jgi:hypothetical protein
MIRFLLLLLTFGVVLPASAQGVAPLSVVYQFQPPVLLSNFSTYDHFSVSCNPAGRSGFTSLDAARQGFVSWVAGCFLASYPQAGLNPPGTYHQIQNIQYTGAATVGQNPLTLDSCLPAGCVTIDSYSYVFAYVSYSRSINIVGNATCPTGFSPTVENGAYVCYPGGCPAAGTPSSLGRLTTISAITEMGYIVPVGTMPNPQCNNQCRVQHAGGQLQCTGYYPINGLVVGGPVYSSCTIDVTHTGTPCNYGGQGGIETLDEFVSRPQSFTQEAGNNGGGGGGGDNDLLLSAIGDNTERTADGIDFAATTLTQIAANQVSADQKAGERNTSLLNKLDQLLGKLTSIDAKTGQGGGGGPDDGEGETTGGTAIGDIGTSIDHPDAGFVVPGETHTGLQALLAGTGIERAPGSCPTWTFNIDFLDASIVMDTHCTLWQQNAAVLEALMLGLWTLGALFILLSA